MSTEALAIIAAIFTGVAAIITAIASVVSAKSRGGKECEEKLKDLRRENESLAVSLHELRMQTALRKDETP